MTEISVYFEWGYRFMAVVISLIQLKWTHSKLGDYCVNQLGVLSLEGSWMHGIVIFQLVKVLLFSIWQYSTSNWQSDENN